MRRLTVSEEGCYLVGAVITHERLVVACVVHGVVPLPARATVVTEAAQVTTEEWSNTLVTACTHRLFQVRIDLDLLHT